MEKDLYILGEMTTTGILANAMHKQTQVKYSLLKWLNLPAVRSHQNYISQSVMQLTKLRHLY